VRHLRISLEAVSNPLISNSTFDGEFDVRLHLD
jgi:hypothetical protein